jgi:hypothetical protein
MSREGLQNQLEIFREAAADTRLSQAQRSRAARFAAETQADLAAIDAWAAWDAAEAAYRTAEKEASDAVEAARGVVEGERERYKRKVEPLRNATRDQNYYQTVRALRGEALSVYQNVKKQLVNKYADCFPVVNNFVQKLEHAINRLQVQTTGLPSEEVDDELWRQLELPTDEELFGGEDEVTGEEEIAEGEDEADEEDDFEDEEGEFEDGGDGPEIDGGKQAGGDEQTSGTDARGTAKGNWSMGCTAVEEGRRWTESGTFQLTVLASGHITGNYTSADQSGQFPVSGQLSAGGAASGSGDSAFSSFTWSGTLSQPSPGARFTGSGTVSLQSNSPEGQTTCGGSWTAAN